MRGRVAGDRGRRPPEAVRVAAAVADAQAGFDAGPGDQVAYEREGMVWWRGRTPPAPGWRGLVRLVGRVPHGTWGRVT